MIARDKKLHFTCCMLIAFVTTLLIGLLSNWYAGGLAGLLTAMGTGVGKEYGDKASPNNRWDWRDIIADLAGAVIGAAIATAAIVMR